MPTYEYICQSCEHEFELFQQMTAPVKRKCPECGKLKLQRLIGTGSGVIFKGGGFYETDYRSESYKKDAEAAKKSASNGDASSTKSEKASSKETAAPAKSASDTGTGTGTSDSKPAKTTKSKSED